MYLIPVHNLQLLIKIVDFLNFYFVVIDVIELCH